MVEFDALNALISAWTCVGFIFIIALTFLVPMLFYICWLKLNSMCEKDLKKKKEQQKQDIIDTFNEIQKGGKNND